MRLSPLALCACHGTTSTTQNKLPFNLRKTPSLLLVVAWKVPVAVFVFCSSSDGMAPSRIKRGLMERRTREYVCRKSTPKGVTPLGMTERWIDG